MSARLLRTFSFPADITIKPFGSPGLAHTTADVALQPRRELQQQQEELNYLLRIQDHLNHNPNRPCSQDLQSESQNWTLTF